MQLDHLHTALRLRDERRRLIDTRDHGVLSGYLRTGSMSGFDLDDEMVELIRPIVNAELTRRLVLIEAELTALGVELPA